MTMTTRWSWYQWCNDKNEKWWWRWQNNDHDADDDWKWWWGQEGWFVMEFKNGSEVVGASSLCRAQMILQCYAMCLYKLLVPQVAQQMILLWKCFFRPCLCSIIKVLWYFCLCVWFLLLFKFESSLQPSTHLPYRPVSNIWHSISC